MERLYNVNYLSLKINSKLLFDVGFCLYKCKCNAFLFPYQLAPRLNICKIYSITFNIKIEFCSQKFKNETIEKLVITRTSMVHKI